MSATPSGSGSSSPSGSSTGGPSTMAPPSGEAQRMAKRKVWPIVVVVIIVLAGIGGGLAYYYSTQKAAKPSIVFSGWVSSGSEFTFDEQMVSNFNAMHSNVSVSFQPIVGTTPYYTQLQTKFVAGNAPAVFYMENDILPQFAHLGYLMNLSTILNQNTSYDLTGFEPSVLNSFYFSGGLFAAPKDWSALFVMFNKNIFNAEHVAYPTNLTTWNWATFNQTLVKLKANESQLPGGGAGYYPTVNGAEWPRILGLMYATGSQWINQAGTGIASNSAGIQTAIQQWYGLYQRGLAGLNTNDSAGWDGGDFALGKVGMVIDGTWTVPVLNASGSAFPSNDAGVGYTTMPQDTQKATMMYNVGLSLNSGLTGTSKWIAEQFLEYFTGPVGEKTWVDTGLALPSRTAILNDPAYQSAYPIDYLSASQFPYAYGWNYNTTNFNQVQNDCSNVISNLYAGKITVAQAYADIVQVTNTDLAGTGT